MALTMTVMAKQIVQIRTVLLKMAIPAKVIVIAHPGTVQMVYVAILLVLQLANPAIWKGMWEHAQQLLILIGGRIYMVVPGAIRGVMVVVV